MQKYQTKQNAPRNMVKISMASRLQIIRQDQFVSESVGQLLEVVGFFLHSICFYMILFYHIYLFAVDSQTIDLGSDDTSNDFDYDNDKEDYEPSVTSGGQAVRELNDKVQSLDLPTFIDHVKELEAKRNANANQADLMAVSDDEGAARNMPYNPLVEDDEGWVDPIQQQILAQEAEEMENAGTHGRLTAPQNEVRKRAPKAKPSNNVQKIDELRSKQIKLVESQTQLVEEQLHLQKILQETASIAQEEAQERLMHIKTQRQIAEIELQQKQKELTK